jgi:hypothetical protein
MNPYQGANKAIDDLVSNGPIELTATGVADFVLDFYDYNMTHAEYAQFKKAAGEVLAQRFNPTYGELTDEEAASYNDGNTVFWPSIERRLPEEAKYFISGGVNELTSPTIPSSPTRMMENKYKPSEGDDNRRTKMNTQASKYTYLSGGVVCSMYGEEDTDAFQHWRGQASGKMMCNEPEVFLGDAGMRAALVDDLQYFVFQRGFIEGWAAARGGVIDPDAIIKLKTSIFTLIKTLLVVKPKETGELK